MNDRQIECFSNAAGKRYHDVRRIRVATADGCLKDRRTVARDAWYHTYEGRADAAVEPASRAGRRKQLAPQGRSFRAGRDD